MKSKSKPKPKDRDINIIKAYQGELQLSTQVIKDKTKYSRKNVKYYYEFD